MIVEIRLHHQQHRNRAEQQAGDGEDGQALVILLQAQKPGEKNDVERFEEFGRLDLADAELDPAHGAVLFLADERHRGEQDEEDAGANQREAPRPVS